MKPYDYGHPVHRAARAGAFTRSGGLCQFCGQRPAVEGHHWAMRYPPEADMTANDLVALCSPCHDIATTLRRLERQSGHHHLAIHGNL